jgi:hypothetical protein
MALGKPPILPCTYVVENIMLSIDTYIETAVWASRFSGDLDGCDLSQEARRKLQAILQQFWKAVSEDGLVDHPEVLNGRMEHHFWLTQNRHGAGFWDGDYPETGAKLTEISHRFPELELLVDDDGLIQVYLA